MKLTSFLACPLALAFFAVGLPAAAQDETAVSMKRTLKAGNVTRYKVVAVADAGGSEVTVERTLKIEIKEIKENGDVVMTVKDEGGKINAMGQEMESPLASLVTITVDKTGRMLKYQRSSDDIAVMAPEIEQLVFFNQDYILPDKEVKPNDTWKVELPNPAVKEKKVELKFTYAGYEKVDDTRVWKIKQTCTAETDSYGSKMTGETTFLVDPEDGKTLRFEGTLKGVPTLYGPVDIKVKANLIKPEPESAPGS